VSLTVTRLPYRELHALPYLQDQNFHKTHERVLRPHDFDLHASAQDQVSQKPAKCASKKQSRARKDLKVLRNTC
jgi:hypothetical protein